MELSWAECRRAQHAVRAAEHGREALVAARPHGTLGIVRSNPPLPLMLYVASREERVVWQGPNGFAILQAPRAVKLPIKSRGWGFALLRLADRQWEACVLAVPPFALLAAAFGLGLARAALELALILILLALVYVTVLLCAGVVTAMGWFFGAFGRRVEASRSLGERARAGTTWSVVLCHQEDQRRAGELLRQASGRVVALVRRHIRATAGRLGGAVPGVIAVEEELTCPVGAVTTDPMRRAVTAAAARGRSYAEGDDVVVLRSGTPSEHRRARLMDSGGIFFWYLFGLGLAVLVCALLVADAERAACAPACDGRPATFRLAVRWLLQRLLLSDPAGLSPATDRGFLLGWLISLASAMALAVGYVAARRYREVVRLSNELIGDRLHTKVLLLVATTVERNEVIAAVSKVNGTSPAIDFSGPHGVADLGRIGEAQILLAQCEQGAVSVGAATLTTATLIEQVQPDYVIMVGICYSLQEYVEFGHIVVAKQLKVLDHKKITESDGELVEIDRGDQVPPSVVLLDRFRWAELHWDGNPVHYGLVLSASTLVESPTLRARLQSRYPDALCGEMEGSGVYAAAAKASRHWILVKAVSDFGTGMSHDTQHLAARNAAEFVVHMIGLNALDPLS